MKERIHYRIDDFDRRKIRYYKVKQRLTWQLYIRPLRKTFIPCDECQEILTKKLESAPINFILRRDIQDILLGGIFINDCHGGKVVLCSSCRSKLQEIIKESPIILGNRNYEPRVELSREWIDDKDTLIEITKEEYEKYRKKTHSPPNDEFIPDKDAEKNY